MPADHVVYVGDGSSDIHVMLHVNRRDGFTIAVSESKLVAQIAKRTVLSDNALATLVPILEEIAGWQRPQIRQLVRILRLPDSGMGLRSGADRLGYAAAERSRWRRKWAFAATAPADVLR
jgi:predicted HAD superfamily phosphohydrolase